MTSFERCGAITPRAPFDFKRTLDFAGAFGATRGTHWVGGDTLNAVLNINGQALLARLCAEGTVEQPALACTLASNMPIDDEIHAAAIDRLAFYLSVGDDLMPFYALAEDDPVFAPVARGLYGYHHVKFPSPFESGCWAVLTQRNTFTQTLRMRSALVEAYGSEVTVDGARCRAFPEPDRIMHAGPDELATTIGHRPKGALLPGVAFAFEQMDERWLRDAPYDDVEAWLKSIRGIGDWSASFILLRGLGRMERMPRGEKRIQEAVARVYGLVSASDDDVLRLGASYGEYVGYWAHYLRTAT